jgi:hypothetical protein
MFTPKNRTVKPGDAFENTAAVVLKISMVVEKLIFTYLWNRYHQQIPGIKLIQIGAISIRLCQHEPMFHCWKDMRGLKLPENDGLHIYSLCCKSDVARFQQNFGR